MHISPFPQSYRFETKPHLFCPGCGHPLVLKILGKLIDAGKFQKRAVIGLDIGCSLLAWNFFKVKIFQTHHGRTVPTMVGYKMAKPESLAFVYQGDGGGYAIGLQALIHSAFRNDPTTIILVNNGLYAMTGGQMAPTTLCGQITDSSPEGRECPIEKPFMGPEMLRCVGDKKAYIARTSIDDHLNMEKYIRRAIENQLDNNSFSMVEILSICPVNWKTDAKRSLDKLEEMKKVFKCGEL